MRAHAFRFAFTSIAALAVAACSDDNGSSDDTIDDTSGDVDTDTTDTDTTTGDPIVGRSVTQTVNSGTVATSPNFRMVFTLGQPTQNQGVYTSSNFRLQGGLIGANEQTSPEMVKVVAEQNAILLRRMVRNLRDHGVDI